MYTTQEIVEIFLVNGFVGMELLSYRKGMEILRLIRERLNLSFYGMAKRIGIPQTAYTYLEKEAHSTTTETLCKAKDLATEAGITDEEFWRELRKNAVPSTKGRKPNIPGKRKNEPYLG